MKRLVLSVLFVLMSGLMVPGVAQACPEISLNGTELRYTGQGLYQPKAFPVVAGGSENIAYCGIYNRTSGKPEGYVARAPDFELYYQGNGYELEFRVESECDSILLINTGAANWYWDDDDNGNLDAKIRLTRASDGWYDIWIGTIGPETCNARLILESF